MKQACLVITWLLTPRNAYFLLYPSVMAAEGEGMNLGVVFGEPVCGLYQVDSLEMFNQERPGKPLPNASWSSENLDPGRAFKCKPFWKHCCVNSLSKGFVILTGNKSLKWSRHKDAETAGSRPRPEGSKSLRNLNWLTQSITTEKLHSLAS